MSDEDIIEYWKKGYSIERIVNFFPSVLWGHRTPSWQMYNRVETVILNYQTKSRRISSMEQTFIETIKRTIKETINEEYTEYKNNCIEELDYKIECKRNEIISSILDNIAINIQERQDFDINPAINIRVETRPIIKVEKG